MGQSEGCLSRSISQDSFDDVRREFSALIADLDQIVTGPRIRRSASVPKRHDDALALDGLDGRDQVAVTGDQNDIGDRPLAGKQGHVDPDHAVNPLLNEEGLSIGLDPDLC